VDSGQIRNERPLVVCRSPAMSLGTENVRVNSAIGYMAGLRDALETARAQRSERP